MIPRRNFHGFTLIELLIVVAIIAILAAIAVPNFLEAQTRSKVARTYADMRTIALGLEAYRTDHNHYPYAGGKKHWGDWLIPLTTPVAFVTTVPKYVWVPYVWQGMHIDYYYYNEHSSFVVDRPGAMPWTVWDPDGTHRYYLSAGGPNKIYDFEWTTRPGSNYNPYDPSNGTTSRGDIIRLGP